MQAKLYSFSKRNNSLSIPSWEGTDVNVVLKSPSSVLRPRIELQTVNPIGYNYVYIPVYSRYYYITDTTYDRGVWSIDCDVDVLASWSSYIRATSAQVLFSSSNYNLDIIDRRIAAEGNIDRQITTATFDGAMANANTVPQGTFCLTLFDGNGVWATGAATTYFMTYQQIQTFAQELLAPDGLEAIKQYFANPMDSIVECYYLPIDIGSYVSLSTTHAIVIGGYQFPTAVGKTALSTNLAIKTKKTTIEIPWVYNDFRRLSPFTTIDLFVPFCGSAPIAPEDCYQQDLLFIDYSVDITSGDVQAICYLKETILQQFSGNLRVTLPIGQSQTRVGQTLGAISGAVGAAGRLSSGNVAGAAGGILEAVGSALSPTETKTCGGFNGTMLGAVLGNDMMTWQKFRLSVTSHLSASSPAGIRAVMGNANTDVVSLSQLSGYCQTQNASVSAPATLEELTTINSMLDSGVYL